MAGRGNLLAMGHPCFVFLEVSGLSLETISHGLCLILFVLGGDHLNPRV